jgi:hypothetical protein
MRKTLHSLQDTHLRNFFFILWRDDTTCRPVASNGTTAHPPNDRCNEYGVAVDIYELHNTVLQEKTCHSDTCQPPVPR